MDEDASQRKARLKALREKAATAGDVCIFFCFVFNSIITLLNLLISKTAIFTLD